MKLPTKTSAQVIADIEAKLAEKSHGPGAAYALIVGAGFSYPIVPLTRELLHERIGDFYYPRDKTQEGSPERSRKQCWKLSKDYWREFNAAASLSGETAVEVDRNGLPANPSVAYQTLFTYRTANALFSPAPDPFPRTYLGRFERKRGVTKSRPAILAGEKFVRDFLQDVLDPGGYEARGEGANASSDYCTTGRNSLNSAHFFLASLLELQQTGELWKRRPFCRTICTTNFDTLLQLALQLVNVLYSLSDRPERGLDSSDFPEDDRAVHLVYTHGSILRHNAASTIAELENLSGKNAESLGRYLQSRDVIVLGYGGWDDSLMSALSRCDVNKHRIYWCNVYSEDAAKHSLAPAVIDLLNTSNGNAVYVSLGAEGANGFMAHLYQALAPDRQIPRLLTDPLKVWLDRLRRLRLDRLNLTPPDSVPTSCGILPAPKLDASLLRIHGTACSVVEAAWLFFCSSVPLGTGESMILQARAKMLVDEGFALALAGNLDKALRVWALVLPSKDVHFEAALAANYIGIVHDRAGRVELAIRAYTRAFDLGWSAPFLQVAAFTNRGAARSRLDKTELAIEDLSRAVAIWENHPPAVSDGAVARALIYRGVLHERNGNARDAEEDFSRALALKDVPEDCRVLMLNQSV